MGPGLTSLEFVTVGDPGNEGDWTNSTGYGRVDHAYGIGKYEVTAGQYTEFLNAVAKTDPYGLYNTCMWYDDYGCKIQRSGETGQLHVQRGGGLGEPAGELRELGRRGTVRQLAAQRAGQRQTPRRGPTRSTVR